MNILNQFLLSHVDIANSHAEAEHLLHLELDCSLQIFALAHHVVRVSQLSGKLSSLVKSRSQQPGNLLDQSIRSHESIIGLGQLLHFLLILVQLLEIFLGHTGQTVSLGFITVLLISKHAHLELCAGNVTQH